MRTTVKVGDGVKPDEWVCGENLLENDMKGYKITGEHPRLKRIDWLVSKETEAQKRKETLEGTGYEVRIEEVEI